MKCNQRELQQFRYLKWRDRSGSISQNFQITKNPAKYSALNKLVSVETVSK